jgi:hypothetical protein
LTPRFTSGGPASPTRLADPLGAGAADATALALGRAAAPLLTAGVDDDDDDEVHAATRPTSKLRFLDARFMDLPYITPSP